MTATIHTLSDHRRPTEADVSKAWEAYAELAGQIVDNPRLLIDRAFFNDMTRKEAAYKRLLLALEGNR